MKALRTLRVVLAFLVLFFLLLYLIPVCRADYDWTMIAILVLFIVLIPAALVSSIKMEKFPHMVPSIGVLKFNIIFSAIMMAVMAAASVLRIVDGLSPWMWVSGIFVFAYQLVNNLILYKVKTNASED